MAFSGVAEHNHENRVSAFRFQIMTCDVLIDPFSCLYFHYEIWSTGITLPAGLRKLII
jgi:hypothetical protein